MAMCYIVTHLENGVADVMVAYDTVNIIERVRFPASPQIII